MKKFFFMAAIIFASCKKTDRCETWKFYDECQPKSSQVVCNNPSSPDYESGKFCGSELKNISKGSTKVIHEDANAKIVRHFVEKIN